MLLLPPLAMQVVQLAEAAQAWQRRAQQLEQQLIATEAQQREHLASARADFAAQLQVRGALMVTGGGGSD